MKLATLCYVRRGGRTLMLHRVKKKDDVHEGKWNGLGGKLEPGESPEDCVVREIREEAGLRIKSPVLKGVLTFPDFAKGEDWYVFVFTASSFTGRLIDSPEGELRWIPDRDLLKLNLWEGDRVFLPLLRRRGHFSGKFHYRSGRLVKYKVEKY
ncbi:MAG TPA: DNA mismatch repair protein MutT [Elusimicrobia bacterium]|nr:DNA mismatch repair protein MutT [Elusimicrobiota bacterium]